MRPGSSLKRTGETIDDSHRTTDLSTGYEPKRTNTVDLQGLQQIPVHTPRTRKKIMGEREDEQALKLNETMDEFSSMVNQCLSQLSLEMQKVDAAEGCLEQEAGSEIADGRESTSQGRTWKNGGKTGIVNGRER
eukprot:3756980-Amphidinium_carterae.1